MEIIWSRLETQWKVAFAGVERSALGLRQGPARQPTSPRIRSLVLQVGHSEQNSCPRSMIVSLSDAIPLRVGQIP